MIEKIVFSIMLGYFLGCITPSYYLGKWLKNIDIRKKGSKNAGTLNAFKVLGFWPGILTFVVDAGKGAASVLIAFLLAVPELFVYASAISCILGHRHPFQLEFKGGKVLASIIGIILAVFIIRLQHSYLFSSILILAYIVARIYEKYKKS